MEIPERLAWWQDRPGGAEWLEGLARLAAECASQWDLSLGRPFDEGNVSFVVAAQLADGSPTVLKLNFPDRESEFEADALMHWHGKGTVLLLDYDPTKGALLLERCIPGTPLWKLTDEQDGNQIAAAILRRLWHPPPPSHPFRRLADEATRWANELPHEWEVTQRPFERTLIERAVAEVNELVPSQGEQILLHQDFHAGNILSSQREPWLVIDPKPIVGEREFDAASLLRDRRSELASDTHPQRRIRRRLDQLAAELDLDRERLRGWGIIHALAWGLSGESRKVEADMIACARWLAAV